MVKAFSNALLETVRGRFVVDPPLREVGLGNITFLVVVTIKVDRISLLDRTTFEAEFLS